MIKKSEKHADLHIHTIYSDGIYTPAQVVNFAHKTELAAIAITDHDITEGVEPAIKEAKKHGLEVIPGIELSCELEGKPNSEIHILGYYGDFCDKKFQKELDVFRKTRVERASKILKKLSKLKIYLDEKELLKKNPDTNSIGRLHIAQLLLSEGYAVNIRECFDKWLAEGKPAYHPKYKINPKNAIELLLAIDSIPVLAHPKIGADDIELVKKLKGYGLAGIEAYASKHGKKDIEKYLSWAKELELLVTGGSDFHNSENGSTGTLGALNVPYKVAEELKEFITSPRPLL